MKVVIVMPAYYAEKTVKKTFEAIPKGSYDEIILVDDCSQDKTCKVAKSLGISVVRHEKNKGYGGNQKTCYREALKRGADIIVLLHPDFQYDPTLVPEMTKPIKEGKADVVYGSRMLKKGWAKRGGMPWWKRMGNRMLTTYFNVFLGTHVTDAATGYIAYSRKVLETISFEKNSDGFTFDEEAILQIAACKFKMAEIPIPSRYEKESSSISFIKSAKYGMSLFYKVLRYILHQMHLWHYPLLKRKTSQHR